MRKGDTLRCTCGSHSFKITKWRIDPGHWFVDCYCLACKKTLINEPMNADGTIFINKEPEP